MSGAAKKRRSEEPGGGGEGRLHDLYERIERARGLPPEEAVRICKSIVNDAIRDDGMDPGDMAGPRGEHWRRRPHGSS